ncbi:hypothetical protein NHX12_007055 [Muraenolepis orangiensis]|uniref:TIR domain-containing protein n=1 Tax=Muraenolepis orangiensis TaxID=630683 RepID=A0A9Q0IB80_9TELE|nr:hypothetical protein NHX12_007055 [Muraenolepis orangiensis]
MILFDFDQCVNDTLALLISILTSTFIIVTTSMATVAHIFYWDASYVLHYLKAKWKGYGSSASPGSVYDVFVTYDTKDPWVSEWVLEKLRVKLEDEGDKALPLCLEERDWPPGTPLIDNLTHSIRCSRKTLFVLTQAYAKTGVFRLAMYLAHQRLLDENLDVILVLMLEPALQHSHFLRLRRRLCGESIVEWPRTAAAEPWFWQNLRNVVRVDNQTMYTNLSYNKLAVVKTCISRSLKLLNLAHNQIAQLSNGFLQDAPSLKILFLNDNKLAVINQTTFLTKPYNNLETLSLHNNPFQCSCDALDFILWIEDSNVTIPGLATYVDCYTSVNSKPQVMILFDFDQCVNDTLALLISILTSTFIIVTTSMATVAHIFYWDASYVLHYLKAKWKGYGSSASPGSVYDVFVTYDTKDPWVSEWVLEKLRVKLEDEGDKALPLCLEERDWPPGTPLIDNLTHSIRCSRKTLFVLTQAYAKTGVFRLTMYLAHQRLLDENLDVILVLMLEPALQHSHFLRLRRRLCGESIVEWPRTAAAEPWFWQNLRNVVRVDNQTMYTSTYSQYFTGSQERE